MPDKKTLELILDKLQKYVSPVPCIFSPLFFLDQFVGLLWLTGLISDRKDIYGVYAEPVDPDEVSLWNVCL